LDAEVLVPELVGDANSVQNAPPILEQRQGRAAGAQGEHGRQACHVGAHDDNVLSLVTHNRCGLSPPCVVHSQATWGDSKP
jgi:hypothetical protein